MFEWCRAEPKSFTAHKSNPAYCFAVWGGLDGKLHARVLTRDDWGGFVERGVPEGKPIPYMIAKGLGANV